ncbi:hypothetical protein UPYG_G00112350 [Umbra pygmaea]|uniref:Nucleoside diphosphate kinase n=1 Tax=Umbra pygmaea TaxID=75934 RepID=A0ABD0XNG9_UMBPY
MWDVDSSDEEYSHMEVEEEEWAGWDYEVEEEISLSEAEEREGDTHQQDVRKAWKLLMDRIPEESHQTDTQVQGRSTPSRAPRLTVRSQATSPSTHTNSRASPHSSKAGSLRPSASMRSLSVPAFSYAKMICLFLTIFANVFQTGWTGVNERSFIAVKPDGVQRRLVGEIIQRFEKKGFRLVGMKLVQASEDLLREHYWDLRDKPFFKRLVHYMSSGPIVAMVWQGLDVVKMSRKMLGETNPADSLPGTIRGDYCVEMGRNVIHGSDSVESAQREISLWFSQDELQCWEDSSAHWIYE